MRPFDGLQIRWLSLAVFAMNAVGCRNSREKELEWKLTDGRSLADVVGNAPEVVVITVDPASCFTCATALGPFLSAMRDSTKLRIPVRALWLRPTSAAEDRRLAPLRVRIDGTLDISERDRRAGVLYLVRGKVVARIEESAADLILSRVFLDPRG